MFKDYDTSVLYYPGKSNVVVNTLIRLSMSSVSHIEYGKKELVHNLHKLAQFSVFLVDVEDGDIII